MIYGFKKFIKFWQDQKINAWIIFFALVYLILVVKIYTFEELESNIIFGAYSIAVGFHILSRFLFAYFYSPKSVTDESYLPTVSFGVPAKNEEANIAETLLRIARSDYPKEKLEIIAVNDGSTDGTLREMIKAGKIIRKEGVKIRVVNWTQNRGKREGMAESAARSKGEIMIFIDSDSFVQKDTARAFVKYFADPRIAAVAGHAYVANAEKNMLTKMQAVRYYVAFKAYKASEALFGAVTCCSGCCAAYRRGPLMEVLVPWRTQKFLGVPCTYGDDRSLTNFLLRKGHYAIFAPDAITHTVVPDNFRQFMRQQLRWKKSWLRESFKAGFFMWRRNPIMSFSFYLGVILPLMAPVVVMRALVWYPYNFHSPPWYYLFGLLLMALVYGIYYYIHTRDSKWLYGVFFATFYTLVLMWQLPYAILNLRDSRWGTR